MTEAEEEAFIVSQVMSSRHSVDTLKRNAQELRFQIARAEAIQAECEQAMIDYMQANGLKQTVSGDIRITLGKSQSVDITDIESVPERYIRIKETKEVNKALIKAENLPANNWLAYSEKPTLTIKNKES